MNEDAIESILADFQSWLMEAKEAPPPEPTPSLDVATVLQHFIALRQEVNLQTKATRAQQEQGGEAIALLQQALEAIPQAEPSDDSEQEALLRPLLKTLIDAHDALSLAEREVKRMLDNPPPLPEAQGRRSLGLAPPEIKLKIPHWARWIGLDASIEAQLAPLRAWCAAQNGQPASDESADRLQQIFDALLVGYRMSLQRLSRTLEQQGLETIECVGESFDPEAMEVAEVIREEGRTSTEVLEVIRNGYRWRGRVFRYAQVRVAKP